MVQSPGGGSEGLTFGWLYLGRGSLGSQVGQNGSLKQLPQDTCCASVFNLPRVQTEEDGQNQAWALVLCMCVSTGCTQLHSKFCLLPLFFMVWVFVLLCF